MYVSYFCSCFSALTAEESVSWKILRISEAKGNGRVGRTRAQYSTLDSTAKRKRKTSYGYISSSEGDAMIINMPSAGSYKSRVIEFSTSITSWSSPRRASATSGNRMGCILNQVGSFLSILGKPESLPSPLRLKRCLFRPSFDSSCVRRLEQFLIRSPNRFLSFPPSLSPCRPSPRRAVLPPFVFPSN